MSDQQTGKILRIGIIRQAKGLEDWQARCLERLLSLDFVSVVLVIVDQSNDGALNGKLTDFRTWISYFLSIVYFKFQAKIGSRKLVDYSEMFNNNLIIIKDASKEGTSLKLSTQDRKIVADSHLDAILKFTSNPIDSDIIDIPRYGTWSYCHSDHEKREDASPCFWEIYNGDDVTGAALLRLTNKPNVNVVLKKGYFRTVKYSYSQNIDRIYYGTVQWPAQVCVDIHNGIARYLADTPVEDNVQRHDIPNNVQILLFAIILLRNMLVLGLRALFRHDQWNIGVVRAPISIFLLPDRIPEIIWYPLVHNRHQCLADPFGIKRGDKITILCEEYDYRSDKGVISVIEFSNVFSHQVSGVMKLPVHMSYPYLLEREGEIYCIPETNRAQEVALYKAIEFPYSWVKECTLISNIVAVDPTIFQYQGLWWLTCTDVRHNHDTDLLIFYAMDIMGPWKEHLQNPVKSDIRSARPAGTPFIQDGHLYRPAQDCSKVYGGRIMINHVTCLTKTEFREELASIVEPCNSTDFGLGIHTISAAGEWTLLDGKRLLFVPNGLINMLKRIVRGKF